LHRRVRLSLASDLALQRLQQAVQRDERHDLSLEEVADPRLLAAVAIFVNGAKGHARCN
jgi:hypothetical protein